MTLVKSDRLFWHLHSKILQSKENIERLNTFYFSLHGTICYRHSISENLSRQWQKEFLEDLNKCQRIVRTNVWCENFKLIQIHCFHAMVCSTLSNFSSKFVSHVGPGVDRIHEKNELEVDFVLKMGRWKNNLQLLHLLWALCANLVFTFWSIEKVSVQNRRSKRWKLSILQVIYSIETKILILNYRKPVIYSPNANVLLLTLKSEKMEINIDKAIREDGSFFLDDSFEI
jgi:hypothetical protein